MPPENLFRCDAESNMRDTRFFPGILPLTRRKIADSAVGNAEEDETLSVAR